VLRAALDERVGDRAGRLFHVAYNGLVLESLIGDKPPDRAELEQVLGALPRS
jgi:hypothetical protein